ncbi:MAG: sugar phosphate isomerase/epimerase [Firmicutes bacterium]|nr:sugar phosphate isomerase/epimerase [Bacillota bacterium]
MKLGVSVYSFFSYMQKTGARLTDICTLAKEIGYEGIEFLNITPERKREGFSEPAAKAVREHCERIGLSIIAYTVDGDFIQNGLAEEVSRLKRCVDTAALLGAPLLRHDAARGYDGSWRDAVRKIAPAVREITVYAEAKGIRTCTENHGFFLQDAARVEELILQVDHENYGWLVDIGNFACADEDSVYAVTIAAPYAFHVHAKDFLVKPAKSDDPGEGWFRSRHGRYLRGTVVGHGCIPVRACVEILRKNGYDGWLSYEFEGMEDNLPALEAGIGYLRGVI